MAAYNEAYKDRILNYDKRYDININNEFSCKTIPSILVIDSLYRSSGRPDDYKVNLINKYRDVTSFELVYASIPNSNYNITSNNNKLHIMVAGQLINIINITGGNCTPGANSIGVERPHTFSSLTGVTRPLAGPFNNDNTFTIVHNDDLSIRSLTITNRGANWLPGETVTINATDFTPNLGTDLTFTIDETTTVVVEIPAGLYTNPTLANAISTALATINTGTGEIFTGSIVSESDADLIYSIGIMTVTSTTNTYKFGIKVVSQNTEYMPQSMARLLGFRPANKYSEIQGTDHTIISDYPVMLEMDHYIAMFIEGMERSDGNHSGINGAFCIVPLDSHHDNFGMIKESNKIDNDNYKYYFNQPKNLSELHITFKDWEGNIYDFNGLNHLLVFKVETAAHRQLKGI